MWQIIIAALFILTIVYLELPKYLKKKKSQDAPVTVHRAVYVKTTNLTANAAGPLSDAKGPFIRKMDNDPIVWFKFLDTGKTMRFDCYQHIAVKMPPEGTEGDLEIKGKLFRSFTWDGGKLVMDENDTTPQSVFLRS